MRRHKVPDEHQNRHDHMFRHTDHITPRDLRDRDAAVGLVRRIQVHMVRPNARRDGQLELLRLREPLRRQVARVERRGDDDFGVDELLVEGAVRAFFVGRRDECVAVRFNPFAEAEFALCRA
jgi:hypothetical protein